MAFFATRCARVAYRDFLLPLSPHSQVHTSSSLPRLGIRPFTIALHSCARVKRPVMPRFTKAVAVAGIGFGILQSTQQVHCDAIQQFPDPNPESSSPEPLPVSSVSLYQLSFGTISGICAGVFIKKGAKAVAWFLGGIFVLLQYLGSTSIIRVDWTKAATRFENAFYRTDTSGSKQPPTISGLWNFLVDFLTADFQPRASFVAGLILGLRIG